MPLARTVLVLAVIRLAAAQAFGATCAGATVPDVAALASQYPPIWQTAQIVPGDTVARALFNSIRGPALAYPPTVMQGGNPVQTGYPASDPHCWWTYSNCVNSKLSGVPTDAYTCQEPGTWGLSLDDGPNCVHAPLYNLLKQNNQQATLFYIGSNVASYPNEARLGLQNGHIVCAHTWSHQYTTSLTNEQVFAELYYSKKILKDITGYSPRCWRPPYGDVDDRVRTYAQALELWTTIWDNDTNDWEASQIGYAVPNADYAQILAGNYKTHGTLVLTHELDTPAINLFLQHWPTMKARMTHIVSATSCLNVTSPYAESNAPLIPNFAAVVANNALPSYQPPATAGSTGPIVFAGQQAFMASIRGVATGGNSSTPVVVSSSVVPSVAPLTTSTTVVVVQPSTVVPVSVSAAVASQSAALALVSLGTDDASKVSIGVIVGAVAGGLVLISLLIALILCARHRSWFCWRAKQPKKKQPIYLASPEMGYVDGFPRSPSQTALLNPNSPYMRSESSFGASRSQLDLRSPSPEPVSPPIVEHQMGLALGGNDSQEALVPVSPVTSQTPLPSPTISVPAAAQHRRSQSMLAHQSLSAFAISNDGKVAILAPGAARVEDAPPLPSGLFSRQALAHPVEALKEADSAEAAAQHVRSSSRTHCSSLSRDRIGESATKLVLESQRALATDTLRPYADAQIRMLARETRQYNDAVKAGQDVYSQIAEDEGQVCSLLISALASRRNQRALLVYHAQRLDKLKDLFWAAGAQPGRLLAQGSDERKNMSPSEVDFLRSYSELVSKYRAPFIEDGAACDVTGSLDTRPPKELYIQVKVIKDIGEIYTESGTISFKKDSLVLVRRPDVERLLLAGYLEEV